MSAQQPPKVAGIDSYPPPFPQTAPPDAPPAAAPAAPTAPAARPPSAAEGPTRPAGQLAAVQDRLTGWICDLTALHDLTGRLVRTATLDDAVRETLRAGAFLLGARRGLLALGSADGAGPGTTIGLGLGAAELGHIETIPHGPASSPHLLGSAPADGPGEIAHPHIAEEEGLDPRHREVAARLGFAASYAVPLDAGASGRMGAAVWLYDEPARPTERQRHLLGLYVRHAAEHIARRLDADRTRCALAAVTEELLPGRLPRVPGVRLAVRHRTGAHGGGDWYDVLPLPEGALGLAVGGVTGSGPGALAAMGRLRASLRAYAVMEGEDPVAVLSDLELLLRLTEPARSATALFGYAERAASGPGRRTGATRIVVAGAGHCPPMVVGPRRAEFAETALSAPLNMLTCWEAPSVELHLRRGETLLLYSSGLLHRTGEPLDRAFARLEAAAGGAAPAVRDDPEALVDHVLASVLPDGRTGAEGAGGAGDIVLLAARF